MKTDKQIEYTVYSRRAGILCIFCFLYRTRYTANKVYASSDRRRPLLLLRFTSFFFFLCVYRVFRLEHWLVGQKSCAIFLENLSTGQTIQLQCKDHLLLFYWSEERKKILLVLEKITFIHLIVQISVLALREQTNRNLVLSINVNVLKSRWMLSLIALVTHSLRRCTVIKRLL